MDKFYFVEIFRKFEVGFDISIEHHFHDALWYIFKDSDPILLKRTINYILKTEKEFPKIELIKDIYEKIKFLDIDKKDIITDFGIKSIVKL
jgi:hypothetical protein